jgi:hypothetical protein
VLQGLPRARRAPPGPSTERAMRVAFPPSLPPSPSLPLPSSLFFPPSLLLSLHAPLPPTSLSPYLPTYLPTYQPTTPSPYFPPSFSLPGPLALPPLLPSIPPSLSPSLPPCLPASRRPALHTKSSFVPSPPSSLSRSRDVGGREWGEMDPASPRHATLPLDRQQA